MVNVRRGFSLVEVLVAISVIIVLVGIVTIGFRTLGNKGNNDATEVVLNNSKGLTAEYQAQLKKPYNPAGALELPDKPMSDPLMRRHGAILQTSGQLVTLSRIAAIREAVARMPSGRVVKYGQYLGDVAPPATVGTAPYQPGDRWSASAWPNGFYVCIEVNSNTPGGAGWVQVDNDSPVLLDGWNNPVLFVTKGGMYGTSANPLRLGQLTHVLSPSGVNERPPLQSPSLTAYWVSAGPDGDFTTGDDNVFSFGPATSK